MEDHNQGRRRTQLSEVDLGKRVLRIISFKDSKIIGELNAQEMGLELLNNPEGLPDCLNFTGVSFLSSRSLGKFITLDKRLMKEKGYHLSVCNLCPDVYETLKITKLGKLFEIYENEADYLENPLK